MFKRCIECRKRLWTKYDVVKYNALDCNGNVKEYKAYLCRSHGDEIDQNSAEADYVEMD